MIFPIYPPQITKLYGFYSDLEEHYNVFHNGHLCPTNVNLLIKLMQQGRKIRLCSVELISLSVMCATAAIPTAVSHICLVKLLQIAVFSFFDGS